MHGDEPSSVTLAEELVFSLDQAPPPSEMTVFVVPIMNPDGLSANTRMNGRGVDLNRNFPTESWQSQFRDTRHYPGTAPASEAETKIIISLIEKYLPKLIINIHAPLGCINWDGPAEELAKVMSSINGYPLKPDIGYTTPGSLGNYAGRERNIPFITFELREAENARAINKHIKAVRATLLHLVSKK